MYGRGICLLFSEHGLKWQGSLEDFPKNKRAGGWAPLLFPAPAPIHRHLHEPAQHQHSPPALLTASSSFTLLWTCPFQPDLFLPQTLQTLSAPSLHSNVPSVGVLFKVLLQNGNVHTAPMGSTTPNWLLPQGERKIIAHTSPTEVPAVGWGQTSGLTRGPTQQQNLRDNTGKCPVVW